VSSILFLCTGNAARSVMAGVALEQRRPDLHVRTAGTLTVDGMPIGWRTRAALEDVGLPWPRHASKQAERAHVERADLVVALAPEHVNWVRREHPEVAHRTATLIRLVETLGPLPTSWTDRLDTLGLARVELEPWEEVLDPGGGEVEQYVACARQIVELIDRLAAAL
jgi:protein-tyrosine phosphatase